MCTAGTVAVECSALLNDLGHHISGTFQGMVWKSFADCCWERESSSDESCCLRHCSNSDEDA